MYHVSHWGTFKPVVSESGELMSIDTDPADPAPSHLLGNITSSVNHRTRIARPAVRRGWLERGPGPSQSRGAEEFVELPWSEVIPLLGDELNRVYRTHGAESVFGGSYGWSSAGRFHHAQSQVHRFLNTLGGYVRSINTYSAGASYVLLPHLVGADQSMRRMTSWSVLSENTEQVVAFGGLPVKNFDVASGGKTIHDTKAILDEMHTGGTRFILVGALRDDMSAGLEAEYLAIRPGTDTAAMLAMCYVLETEDLVDRRFVAKYTSGYDQVRDYLLGVSDGTPKTPEWATAICGLEAAALRQLARQLVARRTVVTVSLSLQRTEHGEQPVWAALTLASMIGQIGLPGGGFGHGYGSIADAGYPDISHALPTLPQGLNKVTDFIPVARIADMLLNPGGEFAYDGGNYRYPEVKLVYWAGGNPFHHHQDLSRLMAAFRRLDTLVVHEQFWNSSARFADIVLPANLTLERNDMGVSRADPYLTAMPRAIKSFAEAKSDFAIFAELAGYLGRGEEFTEGRDDMEWIEHLYQNWRQSVYTAHGAEYPEFDEFWSAGRLLLKQPAAESFLGDFRADPIANSLATASGKIELYSPEIASFGYVDCVGHANWFLGSEIHGSERSDRFPLVLLANQPKARLHSQLDVGKVSQDSKINGREPVRMNPQDALDRGIGDGDVLRVFNDRGACLAGCRISDSVEPGVVQMSTGAWFDPLAQPDGSILCVAGNVNVLSPDVGVSQLSQGCSGSRMLVQIEPWSGDLPPVTVYDLPAGVTTEPGADLGWRDRAVDKRLD